MDSPRQDALFELLGDENVLGNDSVQIVIAAINEYEDEFLNLRAQRKDLIKERDHLRSALEQAAEAIMRLCEDPSGLGCPQLFGPGCPRADDPPQCPFGRAPTKEEVRACWMAVFGLTESEKDGLSEVLGELRRSSEEIREVMQINRRIKAENTRLRAERDALKKRVGELEFRETVAANTVLHLTTCFARLWRSVLNRQFDSRSLVGDVALDMKCEIEEYLKNSSDPPVERKLKEALNV